MPDIPHASTAKAGRAHPPSDAVLAPRRDFSAIALEDRFDYPTEAVPEVLARAGAARGGRGGAEGSRSAPESRLRVRRDGAAQGKLHLSSTAHRRPQDRVLVREDASRARPQGSAVVDGAHPGRTGRRDRGLHQIFRRAGPRAPERSSAASRRIAEVLVEFVRAQALRLVGSEAIKDSTFVSCCYAIERLYPFLDRLTRVNDLTKGFTDAYMAWAKAEGPAGGGYTHNTARTSVYALRFALELVLATTTYRYYAPFPMPPEELGDIKVFDAGDECLWPVCGCSRPDLPGLDAASAAYIGSGMARVS